MAYAIIHDYISHSLYPLKAPYEMVPLYITIHNTANDASAAAEIAYMKRNDNQTSYHVAVDDKHVIQAIPISRTAWHAGDNTGAGNMKSIGIEICYSKSGGDKYKQAEANAIEYTAQLLKKYNWGIDRVKFHKEWSRKNCPHRILDEGRGKSFKESIAKRLTELNESKKEVDIVEGQKLTAAQESVRQEAIRLKITDGNDPFRMVNQFYAWGVAIPQAQKIEKLERRIVELEKKTK